MMRLIRLVFITTVLPSVFSHQGLVNHLQTTGYEKEERPGNDDGTTDYVKVQLGIYKIGPLTESDFSFSHGIYLRQWWRDSRLVFDNSSFMPNLQTNSLAHLLWVPDLTINEPEKIVTFDNNIRSKVNFQTGEVYQSKSVQSVTHCPMDLFYYPMDTQHCDIVIESFAFSDDEIKISWHEIPLVRANNLDLDGYSLEKIEPFEEVFYYAAGNTTVGFKQLKARFTVKRSPNYHVFRTYIPSILLLFFAFGTFWVPDAAVPARVAMIVTTFLSNMLILQSVTEKTGKVDYVTALQIFLLTNIVSIVITLMEYLLVLRYRTREKKAKNQDEASENVIMDPKCKTTNETVFLNMNTNDGLHKRTDRSNADRDLEVNKKFTKKTDEKPRRPRTTHKVDKISQILFPVAYSIFCIVYFSVFLSKQ